MQAELSPCPDSTVSPATDDHIISLLLIERALPIVDRVLAKKNPTPDTATSPWAGRQLGGRK
ncbi:hypothetical protein HNQ77_002654 [Silvibacterium bohemicum]|uniref:Uncharacterized protein n=1 Tax=Silvibacterium bohemicum TaxID=1577686 RepID=A0A841K223_9BACT|nr:hypothetical protein [Silvibacterium bohemicum]